MQKKPGNQVSDIIDAQVPLTATIFFPFLPVSFLLMVYARSSSLLTITKSLCRDIQFWGIEWDLQLPAVATRGSHI